MYDKKKITENKSKRMSKNPILGLGDPEPYSL